MFILYLDFTRRIRKNFTPWYLLYFRNKKIPEQFEGPRGKKRVPGGYEGAGKKGPNQFEGGGEKKGWPGEVKVLKKQSIRRRHEKKSARGRCLGSCSCTLFLLDDNIVDKLFSF